LHYRNRNNRNYIRWNKVITVVLFSVYYLATFTKTYIYVYANRIVGPLIYAINIHYCGGFNATRVMQVRRDKHSTQQNFRCLGVKGLDAHTYAPFCIIGHLQSCGNRETQLVAHSADVIRSTRVLALRCVFPNICTLIANHSRQPPAYLISTAFWMAHYFFIVI